MKIDPVGKGSVKLTTVISEALIHFKRKEILHLISNHLFSYFPSSQRNLKVLNIVV